VTDIGIKERRVGDVTVLDTDSQLRINLRFGGSSVPLSRAIDSLLEKGANRILLNLEGVVSISARSLGEIVSIYVTVKKNSGQFKLFNLKPLVRELMETTKLLTVFDVFENESQAVASFQRHADASRPEPEVTSPQTNTENDQKMGDAFGGRVLTNW
jgi:anti-sigma B factor antagonist